MACLAKQKVAAKLPWLNILRTPHVQCLYLTSSYISVSTVCRCDYQITGHFPAQKSWVPANPKCSAPHGRGPSLELWFACGRRLITYCVCTVSRHASPFGNNVSSAFFTDAKCQTIWVVTYNQEAYDEEGKATDIDVLEL